MAEPVNIHECTLVRSQVRVPCSTSNLGAGFDCIGLALSLYVEARFQPAETGSLEIVREGTVANLAASPVEDVLARAFAEPLARRGVTAAGRLVVRSEIPVGRGLGSSAAARVAGYLLAEAALGAEPDRSAAFRYAAAAEGHPDNAAPCALGGLIAVVGSPPRPDGSAPAADRSPPVTTRLPLSAGIGWAYAAPAAGVSTEAARRALPATVTRAEAVDAIRRMPALLRGLESADPELLAIGFDDGIHVPHRLPLIPGAEAALAAGREAGAWAVTISGAGSGLIAACPRGAELAVAGAMGDAFRRHAAVGSAGEEVVACALSPDLTGAQILPP